MDLRGYEINETQLKCGGIGKFIVFKISDLNETLPEDELIDLIELGRRIERHRKAMGKTPHNEYLVINADETYAPEIIEIMKRNGHWG